MVSSKHEEGIWIPTPEELEDLANRNDPGRTEASRRRRPARGQMRIRPAATRQNEDRQAASDE